MSTYKGHRVIENPGASEQAGIEAQYPGVCIDCHGPIVVGQRISKALIGGWHHVSGTCPTRQERSGGQETTAATHRTADTRSLPGGAAQSATEPFENPSGLPNGVWTIEGPRGHRTYRISTVVPACGLAKLANRAERSLVEGPQSDQPDEFRKRHAGKRVLELLTGPDNTASYRGLAWYEGTRFYEDAGLTTPSRGGIGKLWKYGAANEVLVNTFAKLVERGESLPGYTVRFARHCYKCNRLLTTPASIERGVGPICANGGWD